MEPSHKVFEVLARRGLLLKQDKHLPNVVSLITGESLSTSWWGHPKGRQIFAVLSELSDHPDVLFTKLISGKVTLVHRRLWPSLLTVGSAREPWQVIGLPEAARDLLQAATRDGSARGSGNPVKELEKRLLVTARELHSESGRHEILIESWETWARRVGISPAGSAAAGRQTLEQTAEIIGASASALPWRKRSARR